MIRTTTTQVTLDLSDGNYRVGEITDETLDPRDPHNRVRVPIHFNILGRPDLPNDRYEDPAVVIYSTPGALEKFCEDTLKQLRD